MNKLGDSLFFLYLYCQVKTALQNKSSRKKIEYSYCCLGQYYATLEVTKLAILTWKQVTFTKTFWCEQEFKYNIRQIQDPGWAPGKIYETCLAGDLYLVNICTLLVSNTITKIEKKLNNRYQSDNDSLTL